MVVIQDLEKSNPLVVLFTDYNELSNKVALQLSKNGYEVVIVTSDIHNWREHAQSDFKIVSPDFVWVDLESKVDNIAVFIFDKQDIEDYLNSCIILSEKSKAKTLVISSFSKESEFYDLFNKRISELLSNKNIFAGILYLADIFERSAAYKKIVDSTVNNELIIDPRSNYFLISRQKAANQIVRSMLSLSVYGKSIAATSLPISSKTLFKTVLKYNTDLEVKYEKDLEFSNHKTSEKEIVEFDLDGQVGDLINKGGEVLKPKYDWEGLSEIKTYKKQLETPQKTDLKEQHEDDLQTREEGTESVDKERYNFRMKLYDSVKSSFDLRQKKLKVKRMIFYLAAFLLLPYLTFSVAFLSNKSASLFGSSGSSRVAEGIFKFSRSTAFMSQEHFRYMSYIPILGRPYQTSLSYASLLHRDSDVSLNTLRSLSAISELLHQSFSSDIRDVGVDVEDIKLTLDSVYNDYGLLKGDVLSSDGLDRRIRSVITGTLPNDKKMNKIFFYKEILDRLPGMLGNDAPKEYALILVDNRIKRPGGGIIEAVAITTFDKGNLTSVDLYDTAELDKELKGFANPPAVLSTNLDIDEFYLRDALWSPHFPRSAEQAEWFLEKQVNKEINGVLFLDITSISEILKLSGPVNIDGQEVQGENLVSVLKLGNNDALKEDNYFKELLKIVLDRVVEMDENSLRHLLTTLSPQVDTKHIILFFDELAKSADRSVLRGAVSGMECNFVNCISDFISISEVEKSRGVAVNKQVDVTISLEEGLLKREVVIYYKNQSGLAKDRDYISNLLVSVPQDTSFSPATETHSSDKNTFEPELLGYDSYKQSLFATLVSPGKVKAYSISWESGYEADFSEEGQFRLKLIKQPGEESYPLNISIKQPEGTSIYNNNFDLTKDGTLHYNTQLSEDIELVFNW